MKESPLREHEGDGQRALVESAAAMRKFVSAPRSESRRLVWLRRLYGEYNAKYWSNALPKALIFSLPKIVIDGQHVAASTMPFSWTIAVALPYLQFWTPAALREMLLHEMCHMAVREHGHGPQWQAEMQRVVAMRALP
jgi:SprT-like family